MHLKTLYIHLIIYAATCVPLLAGTTMADSVNQAPDSLNQNRGAYTYAEHTLRPFWDTADLFRHRPDVNRLTFTEPGRPVFFARSNMLPHQMRLFLDGIRINAPVNGLFNLGQITPDAVAAASIARLSDSTATNMDLAMFHRYKSVTEPYSRLNYYEGDFNLSNFNAFFSRRYENALNVQLAGQNLSYDGWTGGMFSDRFGYHVRLDKQTDSLITVTFFFDFAKNASRMANFGNWPDYGWKTHYARYHIRYTRKGNSGFILDAAWIKHTHSLSSATDSFSIRNHSGAFIFSLNKNFYLYGHPVNSRVTVNNVRYGGTSLNASFYNETGFSLNDQWALSNAWKLFNRLRVFKREQTAAAIDAESILNLHVNTQTINVTLSRRSRLPLPLEAHNLSEDRTAEIHNRFSMDYTLLLPGPTRLFLEGGAWQIENEIRFDGTQFFRTPTRAWQELSAGLETRWRWFRIYVNYRRQWSEINIAPRDKLETELSYFAHWFNGRMRAHMTLGWQTGQGYNTLHFNPLMQRFYTSADFNNSPVQIMWFKGVIRVSDIEFYMTADNILSFDYSIIEGYPEPYRRLRFGLNWEIFNY